MQMGFATALVAVSMIATAGSLGADGQPKPEDEIALLKSQIARNPDAAAPHLQLVQIYLRTERFEEADSAVKAALQANGQNSELHRVAGDLLFREGHVAEADAEYKSAFRLDKQNPRAIYGISRTFRAVGLRAKAANLVRAAHGLAPGDAEIEAAFLALDPYGPEAVARWQKLLADPDASADIPRKHHFKTELVETELAKAKLLKGRQPLEFSSPYQRYQLPYRVLYDGKRPTGIGMTITINGVKSELRVDTGAGGVTVSSGFAAKAGIERIGSSQIGGIGNKGAVGAWIGYAESMQVGGVDFRNVLVDVKEKGSVDDSGGLLGTDIFRRFLVKLNFHEGMVDLDPLPGPAWDGYAPVDRYDGPEVKGFSQIFQLQHMLLIPTLVSEKQKSEQTHCLFMVDTGADFNNISTNLAPSVTKIHNDNNLEVTGVSGKVKMVYQADKVVLQFAKFRQTNLDLTSLDLADTSRWLGMEVSGTLGLPVLSLFRSIVIDYRDEGILFDFNPY
jgi:cytochrome c-type biogenesis protein CcmH/NrfG